MLEGGRSEEGRGSRIHIHEYLVSEFVMKKLHSIGSELFLRIVCKVIFSSSPWCTS